MPKQHRRHLNFRSHVRHTPYPPHHAIQTVTAAIQPTYADIADAAHLLAPQLKSEPLNEFKLLPWQASLAEAEVLRRPPRISPLFLNVTHQQTVSCHALLLFSQAPLRLCSQPA